jgi:ABC-type antimicrobial peptide transport system permease subunit
MYNVSRRMKELSIRVALGARMRHVMSAALGRPIVLLGVGSVLGLLLSSITGWLLEQIVYQANPRDPVVLVGAVLTMAFLGIAAAAIPALRAMAIDPARLLREE